MKQVFLTVLFFSISLFAQITYQGPASGSVESGAYVTTDDFSKSAAYVAPRVKLFINPEIEGVEGSDLGYNKASEGTNILPLPKVKSTEELTDSVFFIAEFQGMPHRNSIPPDPYIAVGPEHIIQVVNTYFRITDKEGHLLKEIAASNWFRSVYGAASPFDPKVFFDPYDNRWVMVWLDVDTQNSVGYYLISVSDDENPLGVWYNWALPSNVNGSTPSGGWGDYQGVGFDQQALYLTSNQFSFSGSYQGTRIRIIDKFGLYASEPGGLSWTDLWNITYPASSYSCFGIRPVRMYDRSDKFYFAVHSPYSQASNIGVYVLENPVTSPVLTGYSVTVTSYSNPPSAEQLGGSSIPLESGGKNLRNEPVVIDGKLHFVHSVNAGTKSGVHYVSVDLNNMSAEKDIVFADGVHYYVYPALALDSRSNVFMTFSRSAEDEYIGAGFLVYSYNTEEYTQDFLFEPGYGNYVVDYGSGRNRWGDYNGAWTDPAEPNTIWFATEHVASTDHWGVRIAGVRAYPYEFARAHFSVDSVYFGQIEVGDESDEYEIVIKNFGMETLEINSIANSVDDIQILNMPSFPVQLGAFDSLVVTLKFVPSADTLYNDLLSIVSGGNVIKNIKLTAEGFIIRETEKYALYGSTGSTSGGLLTKIDRATAETQVIGMTNYEPVRSLTINPLNNHLYALEGDAYNENPIILTITSQDGAAFPFTTTNVALDAIAFDNDGNLYGAGTDSKLYKLDLDADTAVYLADIPMRFAAITFSHGTNELYASSRSTANLDLIMKVDVNTGDTVHVGETGRGKVMFGIAFDENDSLYAVEGLDYQVSNLIRINTATGEGELIAETGIKGIDGLAFAMDGIVGVSDESEIVHEFSLQQNYPNPFNPETTIKYSIPKVSNVTLKVYDMLGREVAVLVNKTQAAGEYSVKFNAVNLASGLYIYRLKANGISVSKKMLLLK